MDQLDWFLNGWNGDAEISTIDNKKMVFALNRPPGIRTNLFLKIKITFGEGYAIPYTEYLNFFDKEAGYILPDALQGRFTVGEKIEYRAFYSP